jgi:hypothetical protein
MNFLRSTCFGARLLLAAAITLVCASSHASTAVTAAAATFVDSDGDGVPDLTDNAPGASNPTHRARGPLVHPLRV